MDKVSRNRDFYAQVAALHRSGIDRGFLSTLGEPFLTLLYEAIDNSDNAVLITEWQNKRVIGFVSGASDLSLVYRTLLQRPVKLGLALGPALLNPKKLWRMLEIVCHSFVINKNRPESEVLLPKFELLSISVSKQEQRGGVARRLYAELLKHARAKKISDLKIIVGDELDAAHHFYINMGAIPAGKINLHGSAASTIYVQHL